MNDSNGKWWISNGKPHLIGNLIFNSFENQIEVGVEYESILNMIEYNLHNEKLINRTGQRVSLVLKYKL